MAKLLVGPKPTTANILLWLLAQRVSLCDCSSELFALAAAECTLHRTLSVMLYKKRP